MPKTNSTNNVADKAKKSLSKISPLGLTETTLRDKIYTIRGVPVMLDFDLAEYYGYTTKAFNQQVTRNKEKFEGEDFMFQLTWEEANNISRSHFVTLNESARGHNLKYLPYAFTEQGIYMLMTVLKGELATRQSRALVMMFKAMKDYIVLNQKLTTTHENLQIITKLVDHTKEISEMKHEISQMNHRMKDVASTLANTIKRSEVSPIFFDFSKINGDSEILILDGELTRAKDALVDIYSHAKKSIHIIDNYISIKTLHLLQEVHQGLEIILFTDNTNNYLHKTDYLDFTKERPDLKIKFIKTNGQVHDRFIILDEKYFYACGTSSKDAGNKIATIHKLTSPIVKETLKEVVEKLKLNEELNLK